MTQELPLTNDTAKLILHGAIPTHFVVGSRFFAYPHTLFLNQKHGTGYEKALQHFKADHRAPLNLLLHYVATLLRIGTNFGLLSEIDDLISKRVPILSLATLMSWSYSLVAYSGAPTIVKVASVTTLYAIFRVRRAVRHYWKKIVTLQAIVEMYGAQILFINGGMHNKKAIDMKLFYKMLLQRLMFQVVLMKYFSGWFEGSKGKINTLLMFLFAKISMEGFGKTSPFALGYAGWVLATLTNQRWIYLYSGGYAATILEAISHHITSEVATIPVRPDIGDEIAYATYFPNLLYETIHEALV